MINVLVVGNGFDIAHGMPTRYSDFLYFMAKIVQDNNLYPYYANDYSEKDYRWINIRKIDNLLSREYGKHVEVDEIFANYVNDIKDFTDKYKTKIKDNDWLRYFFWVYVGKAMVEKFDSWIDFETEIARCLVNIFPGVNKFSLENHLMVSIDSFDEEDRVYCKEQFPFLFSNKVVYEKCWDQEYLYMWTYGNLFKQLQHVAVFLREYLMLVMKWYASRSGVEEKRFVLGDVGDKVDLVISFNYTRTSRSYVNNKDDIYFINGSLNDDKIILGLEYGDIISREPSLAPYIHRFLKNEQRVEYDYKYGYSSALEFIHTKLKEDIVVHFYGHSLDKNDAQVILNIIRNGLVRQVNVYYYDKHDRQDKIARLHELLGDKDFFESVNNCIKLPRIDLVDANKVFVQRKVFKGE